MEIELETIETEWSSFSLSLSLSLAFGCICGCFVYPVFFGSLFCFSLMHPSVPRLFLFLIFLLLCVEDGFVVAIDLWVACRLGTELK